jgi:signal transduction histidine kinase
MSLRARLLLAASPLALAVALFAAAALHELPHGIPSIGILTGALAAIGVGLACVDLLARRLARSFRTLAMAVEEFGRGDLAVRAPVRGEVETRALAGAFNELADRIEAYRRSSLGEALHARLAARATLDSLPDPVFVLDPDGDIVSSNRAAEELLPPGEGAVSKLDGLDPALRAALDTARRHVLGGKGSIAPQRFDEAVTISGANGERSLLPRAAPVYGPDGNIVAATVVLQDVTWLRDFDELRSDLVCGIAQRFRTPLTSMLMAIHLCLEGIAGALSDDQQDLLLTAREECERLEAFGDELLHLARLQTQTAQRRSEEHPCR